MQSSGLSGSESTQILYYDIMNDFCFCTYNARECLTEKGMSCICKHILAAKLADALQNQGLLEVKIIEDNDFAPLLLSAKSHLQKYDQKIN